VEDEDGATHGKVEKACQISVNVYREEHVANSGVDLEIYFVAVIPKLCSHGTLVFFGLNSDVTILEFGEKKLYSVRRKSK
jgi:hypothetical protein